MTTQVKVPPALFFTIAVAVIIIAVASPFLLIWSLNTLFGLSIASGFYEWLAAFFLLGFLQARPSLTKK